MQLTNNQKKFLRSKAHNIHPIIIIGQSGLSITVMNELELTLKKHELLKVKIRVDKDKKQETVDTLIQKFKVELVQLIGNVLVVYHKFDKNSKIILPRK